MAFQRVEDIGYVAKVVMDEKLLGQLKVAKSATFIIFETPEKGIGFPLEPERTAEGPEAAARAV